MQRSGMSSDSASNMPSGSSSKIPRLSIGSFSRASLLSIKTLRDYHDSGLLMPAHVDARTGYRSYSPGQLADAAVIRRLRDLDVPLEEIRRIVDARDPVVTTEVLAAHTRRMTERLERTIQIVADLQRGLDEPGSHTPVRIAKQEELQVLAYVGHIDRADYSTFLDRGFSTLFDTMQRLGLESAGPGGALYPTEIALDVAERVVAFVPIDARITTIDNLDEPMQLLSLPAVDVAISTFTGSYDNIGAAYAVLGTWVAEHTEMLGEPVREVYLVSPPFHNDPDTYITELQWPIKPANQTGQ